MRGGAGKCAGSRGSGVALVLHERDDNDHTGQEHRNERVGMSGEIEVKHGLRPFRGLDGGLSMKV